MTRPGVMFVVAAVCFAACGSSSKPISRPMTDGGAAGTGAAGTGTTNTGEAGTGAAGTGAAGTGTAGTGAAGTGAAGTGAAGTGAAGTASLGGTTCGGDLLGTWVGFDPNARPAVPPPPDDPCYKLTVYPQDDGTFGATSRLPAPQRREALFKFDAKVVAGAITDRGPVTIAYAASCLAKTNPRPTCSQLAEGLLISGLGEGNVRSVDCVDAGGGCTCTFAIVETGGPYGPWTAANGLLTLTTFAGTQFEKKVTTSYCVAGSTLRFGAAIDGLAAGLSRITFERLACDDGKQNGIEEGVDCGYSCPEQCP